MTVKQKYILTKIIRLYNKNDYQHCLAYYHGVYNYTFFP